MSNIITWSSDDFDTGTVSDLDIFRVPAHIPLNRRNLFRPLATVPVTDLKYEDTSAGESSNFRYLMVPTGSHTYTDGEWPSFKVNPGIPQVDNGNTVNDAITSFTYSTTVESPTVVFTRVDNNVSATETIQSFDYNVDVTVTQS